MPRKAPNYISAAKIEATPVDFKWNKTISKKIFSEEVNDRLFEAVTKSSYKASFAVGIAAMEWVVYRFSGHTNISDALNRIEAAWASAINLVYCRDLQFWLTDKASAAKDQVGAPLEISLALLYSMHHRYSTNNLDVSEAACRQILLAQHVVPKAAKFDAWLSQALQKLANTFPQQAEPDAETYDWSREEIVPQEFFEPDFMYTKESARAALRGFLATLNPGQNPYLRTAEEIKASGFTGTAYSL